MSGARNCPPLNELEEHASDRSHGPRERWISEHTTSCGECANALSEIRANRSLEERLERAFRGPDTGTLRSQPVLPVLDGYRVIGELGRGGMGVVYEAQQLLPPRRVALKVVRGAQYVDETTLRLFQREIRVLARLEHPGIAALYDAGRTRDGEHYFAMELVRGTSFIEYAKTHPRSARLELFMQLCAAIDAAHRRGVVHRDLKPSNVLVTADGRVKVLDFGLAKITDQDVSHVSLVTEAGQIRGTLAYMSPEQARGDPALIDLRSDVYALGVILYQLCTSKLPTDVFGVHIHEAVRRICDVAPARPSSIDPTLRGDLETILSKALEKEPERRYASAAALAEDVRRFASNQVILARPPSAAYELKKLVLRHRLPFALAASLFVLALGTAIWTALLYAKETDLRHEADQKSQAAESSEAKAKEHARLATEESARARREAATHERVREFMTEVFSAADAYTKAPENLTARELLERGVETIDKRFEDDVLVRASLLHTMGDLCRKLSLSARARSLLEEAVAIYRRELPGSVELAASLSGLGMLQGAIGNPKAGLPLQREALAIFLAYDGEYGKNTIRARSNVAQALQYAGDIKAAALEYRAILADPKAVAVLDGATRRSIANDLGQALYQLGKAAEAEPFMNETVDEARAQGPSISCANAINTLGMLHLELEHLDRAEALFREALEMRRSLLGDGSALLRSGYNNLASVQNLRGELRESLESLAMARELTVEESGEENAQVALNDNNQARVYLKLGELEQAELLARSALEMRRRVEGDTHPETADSLVLLAEIRIMHKDPDAAAELIKEAIPVYDERFSRAHITTINARYRLGQAYQQKGDHTQAERWTLEAFEDLESMGSAPAGVRKAVLTQLTSIAEAAGRPEDAENYRALALAKP